MYLDADPAGNEAFVQDFHADRRIDHSEQLRNAHLQPVKSSVTPTVPRLFLPCLTVVSRLVIQPLGAVRDHLAFLTHSAQTDRASVITPHK